MAVGLLVATYVLALTQLTSDGELVPCHGNEYLESFDAPVWEIRIERQLWPPGSRCTTVAEGDLRVLRVETFPKADDWLLAGAAFVSPFALVALYRLRRRAP
jgi:hypothetical protein